ncbi:ABC transporter ATP-binding protein [bacterium BFN5]|nr:ABC transporter ATP-binding protein [bacterium BFN5]QJW45642.1 ABC transporter ATP-binding protein [bacterium BFN5]
MNHHTIDITEVLYTYPDGTDALKNLTLHIDHGESVAIVGSNGSGKTTLLSHLSGVLFPTAGTVNIGGFPIIKQTLPQIRRTVGMVFQHPDDQLFMPTVYDDVAFGPINMGLPTETVNKRVTAALTTVGALDLKDRPPYRLSGGQKRAVAIATVLAMEPAILVMDEPTAALDPFARRQLIQLLHTFTHTKIIATHDLDMALDVCTRTIVLHNGTILADGATAEIFHNKPLLEQAHLEQPLSLQKCPICSV